MMNKILIVVGIILIACSILWSEHCNDSLYLVLKSKELNTLTEREYDYFKTIASKCQEETASEVNIESSTQNILRLDDGLLESKWFLDKSINWEEHRNADFIWQKDEFDVLTASFTVVWQKPVFLSGKVDDIDKKVALDLITFMPYAITSALNNANFKNEDKSKYKIIGRTVQCNVSSSLLSMAFEHHTFDIKILDNSTGELVMAIHHTTSNGVKKKGKGIKNDAKKWAKDFVDLIK